MVYKTMSRKELAAEMKISYTVLWRHIKKLNPDFRKQIAGRILFENEVRYIHEQITGSEKYS